MRLYELCLKGAASFSYRGLSFEKGRWTVVDEATYNNLKKRATLFEWRMREGQATTEKSAPVADPAPRRIFPLSDFRNNAPEAQKEKSVPVTVAAVPLPVAAPIVEKVLERVAAASGKVTSAELAEELKKDVDPELSAKIAEIKAEASEAEEEARAKIERQWSREELATMKHNDLLQLAKRLQLTIPSSITKVDLIELIATRETDK